MTPNNRSVTRFARALRALLLVALAAGCSESSGPRGEQAQVTVTAVVPFSGLSMGGTQVSILGTEFPTTVDSVTLGAGKLSSLVRASSTVITGTAAASAVAGTVDVTVYTTGAGTATCSACFAYVGLAPGNYRFTAGYHNDIVGRLRVVETRLKDKPAAIKIRFDNPRTQLDRDIPGDIAKARAVRKLVGDSFPLAFDANNGFTTGGAIRVGRALEDLGFWWFEEPVQHYHVKAMGEVARALDITVSAGEQTYTLAALADLIDAGVRMIQPDIVKMGGITGLVRCAALAHAHGVELVSHQTQPMIGHMANMHVVSAQLQASKPIEWNDPSTRTHAAFDNPPKPIDGLFHVPDGPGLGLRLNEAELTKRMIAVTV